MQNKIYQEGFVLEILRNKHMYIDYHQEILMFQRKLFRKLYQPDTVVCIHATRESAWDLPIRRLFSVFTSSLPFN